MRTRQPLPFPSTFLMVFQCFFHFGWKTVQFDNKVEILELFCFFWDPIHHQEWINIEDITIFVFLIDILLWWRHLAIFSLFSKWSQMLPSLIWVLLEGYFDHFGLQIAKIENGYISRLRKFERKFRQISQCVPLTLLFLMNFTGTSQTYHVKRSFATNS